MFTQKKKGTGSQGKRQQGTAERKEHSSATPKTQAAEARGKYIASRDPCLRREDFFHYSRQSLFHLLDTDALSLIIK